ncbi:MAG: acyltransferase [Chitinophagaceae bacterium]|nr:MAG: acyltransferase [Chitinophagaceae bacterium]
MGILRFILAVSVVLFHSSSIFGVAFVGGQTAVQAFYIISGFYMTLILKEKYIGANKSYKLFISNRFLRLYPIYWIVFLITLIYALIVLVYTGGSNYGILTNFVTYYNSMGIGSFVFLAFVNVFLFLQDVLFFLGLNTATGQFFFTPDFHQTNPYVNMFLLVPQAWTIGMEITFYLIAPFLVTKRLRFVAVLIAASLVLRLILRSYGLTNDPWSYRFFPTELLFFMLGTVAYHAYLKIKSYNLKPLALQLIFGGIMLLTIMFSFIHVPANLFALKHPAYLVAFFVSLPFVFLLTKRWKRDSKIGDLSYPIYISHILLLTWLKDLDIVPPEYMGLVLTIITVLFSIALNKLVTDKIEGYRQRRLVQKVPQPVQAN